MLQFWTKSSQCVWHVIPAQEVKSISLNQKIRRQLFLNIVFFVNRWVKLHVEDRRVEIL